MKDLNSVGLASVSSQFLIGDVFLILIEAGIISLDAAIALCRKSIDEMKSRNFHPMAYGAHDVVLQKLLLVEANSKKGPSLVPDTDE